MLIMALSVTQARPPLLSSTIVATPPRLGSTVQASAPTLASASVPKTVASTPNITPAQPQAIDYTSLLRDAISSQQAVAPKLDYAAINAQARANAENAVNPFYTKSLNDFLTQQAARKAQQQTATDTAIKGYEDMLANTLKQNEITGQRTAEDTATNLGQINTAADQFQTDSGQGFDAARIAQAKDLAKAGLTGGLASQQQEALQSSNATTEARAGAVTEEQRQAQQLAKARTFEDLARSGELAAQSKEKGVQQAQVDLADFIANQNFDIQNEQQQLEQQRLQAVANEQQNQSKLLLNQFLSKISNPAQYQAAIQAYGGLYG